MKSPLEMTKIGFFIALSWALLASTSASAQSADEHARGHFLAGNSYFEEGRYLEAAEQFLEAHRLSERHTLLVNVATAYERAQHYEEAAKALERYLATLPDDAEKRAGLEARLRNVRERAEEKQRVDAELAEARRLREETSRDEARDPSLPLDTASPVPRKSGLNGLGWAGVGMLGAGGAALVVSLATGLTAKSRHGSLTDRCGPAGDACPPGSASDVANGRSMATASTVTLFAGGALALAGAVLTVLGRERSAEDARAWRIDAGPGQAGLSLRRNF